jgi:uncharacterized membrane protein
MNALQKQDLTDFLTDTTENVGKPERIASAVAGGALIAYGVNRGGVFGALLSLVGGSLAFRGVTGHCHFYDAAGVSTSQKAMNHTTFRAKNRKSPYGKGWLSGKVHVTKSVTINKAPAELYAFWRNFENLPQFMTHLESEIPNSGVVEFLPTVNRGTEVKVVLTYEAPAGELGALVAKLFGEEPSQQVAEDLRRFKRLMETGLIMKIEGQPSGREKDAPKARTASA